MTRKQFLEKAARAEERRLKIPAGWWGGYTDIRGPNGERVRFSAHGRYWLITFNGGQVSRHDSRAFAISKARKLAPAKPQPRAAHPATLPHPAQEGE